jgi:hypothetical protein
MGPPSRLLLRRLSEWCWTRAPPPMLHQVGVNLVSRVVCGDLSGDGLLDLVVVSLSGILYLRNTGGVCGPV